MDTESVVGAFYFFMYNPSLLSIGRGVGLILAQGWGEGPNRGSSMASGLVSGGRVGACHRFIVFIARAIPFRSGLNYSID